MHFLLSKISEIWPISFRHFRKTIFFGDVTNKSFWDLPILRGEMRIMESSAVCKLWCFSRCIFSCLLVSFSQDVSGDRKNKKNSFHRKMIFFKMSNIGASEFAFFQGKKDDSHWILFWIIFCKYARYLPQMWSENFLSMRENWSRVHADPKMIKTSVLDR